MSTLILYSSHFIGTETICILLTRREQSDSLLPLFISSIGGALTLLSLLLIVTFLVFYILSYPSIHVVGAHEVFTLLFIMSFISFGVGIIIDFIGVIAIYLHNILINTRNRPTYIIDFVKDREEVTHE